MTVVRLDGMLTEQIAHALEADKAVYNRSKSMFDAFLDHHGIDVIEAHNLHLDFLDVSRALRDACRERAGPYYLVIHNDVFLDRSEERSMQILEEIDWDMLVPISRFIQESLRRRLPTIPSSKWTVIIHGIDIDRFSPKREAEKKALQEQYGLESRRVILHPARFLPWKGIVEALKGLPRVIREFPDVMLVMTGRAQRIYDDHDELAMYDTEIDRTIRENGLDEHVHIGTYDHGDIPQLTALSNVVIYTTVGDEPFGLVPVEAMACGVPVIVTNSGGLTESVVDGETGFVISKDEEKLPRELATRVIELLDDAALAEELGRRGREGAENGFDKKRTAQDFIRLSRQLLDGDWPNSRASVEVESAQPAEWLLREHGEACHGLHAQVKWRWRVDAFVASTEADRRVTDHRRKPDGNGVRRQDSTDHWRGSGHR